MEQWTCQKVCPIYTVKEKSPTSARAVTPLVLTVGHGIKPGLFVKVCANVINEPELLLNLFLLHFECVFIRPMGIVNVFILL